DTFLPLFTTSDFQLEPIYWDYQFDLHWRASARDDVELLVFGSDDTLHLLIRDPDPNASPTIDVHTFYHRAVGRWLHRFAGGATVQTTLSAGYDVPFQFASSVGNTPTNVDLESLTYTLRSVARVPVRNWLRLDGGLDFEGNRWGPIKATASPEGPPREG